MQFRTDSRIMGSVFLSTVHIPDDFVYGSYLLALNAWAWEDISLAYLHAWCIKDDE